MHHTSAYFLNIANVANTDVPAVQDGILTLQNNHILPPQDMPLLYAYAGSATLTRARLTSPSLRQITQPQIRPINVALLPANNPNVMTFQLDGLKVRALEELAMQATSGVAMNEHFYGVVGLLDRYVPTVAGDKITLRATATTAAVASAWTQIQYTLDDQLPNGTYAMVNSEHISANGIAHRWTFDNQFFRPGMLSFATIGLRTIVENYANAWGEWGRFRNTSQPRLEVLCDAADAVHTMFLEVIKVG